MTDQEYEELKQFSGYEDLGIMERAFLNDLTDFIYAWGQAHSMDKSGLVQALGVLYRTFKVLHKQRSHE